MAAASAYAASWARRRGGRCPDSLAHGCRRRVVVGWQTRRRRRPTRNRDIVAQWRAPADLERITDKLEQANTILAHSGGTVRRLAATRLLPTACRSEDMPTSA